MILFSLPLHSAWFAYLSMALFILALRLSTVETGDLEKLLAATVVDALAAAHLDWKIAADIMRIDFSQMCKQLRGEPQQHISLTRLIRLPFTFWLSFTPALMALIYRKRMEEIAQGFSELKRGA